MKFPIYEALISDNDNDTTNEEVTAIALVERPAIKRDFFAFSDASFLRFDTNDEERIVTGLAMIANEPIYRKDKNRGEHFVYYTAPTIKKIAQRFFRKKYNFNLNLNHNPDYTLDDAYVFESYIIDREKGKLPMEQFKDVPDGSWIISVKIDNAEVWDAVKRGEFKGFSIEGFFGLDHTATANVEGNKITIEKEEEKFMEQLKQLLQSIDV